MTLRSWCQMNYNGHSSPVKNEVEGKPHESLETLNMTSGKSTLIGHFFVKYFLNTCVHICISFNTNNNTPILHTCLTLSGSCLCSTAGYVMIPLWFWVVRVKKTKSIASNWFHWNLNFSENRIFIHFPDSFF